MKVILRICVFSCPSTFCISFGFNERTMEKVFSYSSCWHIFQTIVYQKARNHTYIFCEFLVQPVPAFYIIFIGGFYHGKLIFPPDFPFKPPSIFMLTPSGRFQTNTRLCLSISDFHPDTWNPAWTVRF